MASPRIIAAVLAYLHELYPSREITATTSEAWSMAFASWDDATLESCARQAATTPGRVFFPTPGEIAAFRPAPTIDADTILWRIEQLASYSPHRGMIPPRVEAVRDALGDDVAAAYAAAGGGARLFSDNEKSYDISRRDFLQELRALATRPESDVVRAIGAGQQRPQLPAGTATGGLAA